MANHFPQLEWKTTDVDSFAGCQMTLPMANVLTRRGFLRSSAQSAAALAALHAISADTRGQEKLQPIRLGLIGCGGIMQYHAQGMIERKSPVVFAYLCDVDPAQSDKIARAVSTFQSPSPRQTQRYEDVLDDRNVEAVIVATPHHWHMPIALRAIQAGKDVYIEKPASHVFREGQLLIQAAQKHGRIVQHGTQMRSSPVTQVAGKLLKDGIIGEVKIAKAWNVQRRIPSVAVADADPPANVDYDRWLGPASLRPFNANRFHVNWRSSPEYGNGTIGDDGAHDLDMARWGLGVDTHPVRITGHSSSIAFHDPDYPDNMTVTYQYDENKVLLYEDRQFAAYGLDGFDSGNAFYGSDGYMIFSRRGYFQVYLGPKAEKGPGVPAELRGNRSRGYAEHMDNFLECVRTRKPTNATPEIAHLSCGLIHLGDIACRTQTVLQFDPIHEMVTNCSAANELLTKQYRAPYGLPETI